MQRMEKLRRQVARRMQRNEKKNEKKTLWNQTIVMGVKKKSKWFTMLAANATSTTRTQFHLQTNHPKIYTTTTNKKKRNTLNRTYDEI